MAQSYGQQPDAMLILPILGRKQPEYQHTVVSNQLSWHSGARICLEAEKSAEQGGLLACQLSLFCQLYARSGRRRMAAPG